GRDSCDLGAKLSDPPPPLDAGARCTFRVPTQLRRYLRATGCGVGCSHALTEVSACPKGPAPPPSTAPCARPRRVCRSAKPSSTGTCATPTPSSTGPPTARRTCCRAVACARVIGLH